MVRIDHRLGAAEATRHLIDLGHRCIAHLSGSRHAVSAAQELMDRCGGRESAHEIVLPTRLIVRGSTAEPRARRKTRPAAARA